MTLNSHDDIITLFDLFHDGGLEKVKSGSEGIDLYLMAPFLASEEQEEYEANIIVKLLSCKSVKCIYHRRISNELVVGENRRKHYPTSIHETSNNDEIAKLQLGILNASYDQTKGFVLHCTGLEIEYAEVFFDVKTVKLTDLNGNVFTIDSLQNQWSKWWETIK